MIEIYRNGEVQEISSHQIVRWIQLLPGIPRQPGTAMSLFNTGLAHWARKPSSPVEQGRIPASFSMWIGLEWFGKLEILIWYGFFHGLELFTRVLFSEWKRIWSGIWLLRILVARDFILGSWWYHSPGLQHANSSIFLSRWNSRFGDPQTCSCPWHNMANYSYDINDIWYMSRIVSAFLFKLANTNLKKTLKKNTIPKVSRYISMCKCSKCPFCHKSHDHSKFCKRHLPWISLDHWPNTQCKPSPDENALEHGMPGKFCSGLLTFDKGPICLEGNKGPTKTIISSTVQKLTSAYQLRMWCGANPFGWDKNIQKPPKTIVWIHFASSRQHDPNSYLWKGAALAAASSKPVCLRACPKTWLRHSLSPEKIRPWHVQVGMHQNLIPLGPRILVYVHIRSLFWFILYLIYLIIEVPTFDLHPRCVQQSSETPWLMTHPICFAMAVAIGQSSRLLSWLCFRWKPYQLMI